MEVTKSDIKKLIKNIKTDNFWNHFSCILKRNFSYNGEIQKNRIKIWKQGISFGAFYPIITLELNSQNHLINISNKINPIGKALHLLFPFSISALFISTLISDFEIVRFILLMLILLIFNAIYILVASKMYKYEKEELLRGIYEILKIETASEN